MNEAFNKKIFNICENLTERQREIGQENDQSLDIIERVENAHVEYLKMLKQWRARLVSQTAFVRESLVFTEKIKEIYNENHLHKISACVPEIEKKSIRKLKIDFLNAFQSKDFPLMLELLTKAQDKEWNNPELMQEEDFFRI